MSGSTGRRQGWNAPPPSVEGGVRRQPAAQGEAVRDVPASKAANGAVPSVMIVEDEMLVALDLQESIKSLGYEVVGPYGRLAEAIEGAETQAIDFAILDLNLNGEMTYDLAAQLRNAASRSSSPPAMKPRPSPAACAIAGC